MSTDTKPADTKPAEAKPKNVYKETLNLPQTAFPMEAKLVQNEPARLKKWQDMKLYEQLMQHRANAPKWVLHDGPPFANGDIHMGHVTNKTLKDVFMRFKSLQGFQTPYVPGWDCHGLPIEHKIQEQVKKEGKNIRAMSTVEIRRRCFEYATQYVGVQSVQFQRLGIMGDWANPYMTMAPKYEASTLEVFAEFVSAGLVYKQLKPVQWSIENQTALADAELEYQDVEDPSVYVEFPVENPGLLKSKFDLRENATMSYLIWTTTPWTLPANMAIAANPVVDYAFVKYTRDGVDRVSVVAAALVEKTFSNRAGVSNVSVLKTVTGQHLIDAGVKYTHPFAGRVSPLLPAEYVTTTDGTGLVHTAGGHGDDDYATCMAHEVDIYCPVQANGRFDASVPEWLTGLSVWEANPKIVEKLKELGVLLATETITHSYPHDWRSKRKTISRATEQWFVAVDKAFTPSPGTPGEGRGEGSLRARATDAVGNGVRFVPAWGQARLTAMFQSRPDWCISRQRAWGLPIPVFYNEQGDALLTPQSVLAVSRRFAEKGSDAWFTDSPAELLGDYEPGPMFPKDKLRKEQDIFDVWFESGSSWAAVLRKRPELAFPADLYLEGSDQHRGWFQLSMLPSLGATGRPPYKAVLTHGFIVKPDGTKVSKSDKEYVTATQEIDRHGADLLRLFVCQLDFEGDMAASPQLIKEFGDKYRKIRNTLRYLMSNLYDFNPATDTQEVPPNSLDGWASAELDGLIDGVVGAYDNYQLHRAFRLLYDFCSVQISAVYGNAMKDRLYCDVPGSPLRRRSQTVMHRMAVAMTKLLSPMAVFTADEAWEHIQHKPAGEEHLASVHLTLLPTSSGRAVTEEQREEWKLLMQLRDDALQQLDKLKKEAGLNKALDAEVVFQVDDDATRRALQAYGADLEDLVGAGCHSFAEKGTAGPAVVVKVVDRRNDYKACARSWKRRPDVGADPANPELSLRDAAAMHSISLAR